MTTHDNRNSKWRLPLAHQALLYLIAVHAIGLAWVAAAVLIVETLS